MPETANPPFDTEKVRELTERFVKGGHTFKGLRGISDETMETIYALAFTQYNGGNFQDAEKMFSFLSLFDPYKSKYWMGLGATRQMLKQYKTAIQAYALAAYMNQEDPRPALYAADCYLLLGMKDWAAKALGAARTVSEDNDDQYKDVHRRASSLLELLGEQNGAEAPATEGK